MRAVRDAGLFVGIVLACSPPEAVTSGSEVTGGLSTSTGGESADASTSAGGSTSGSTSTGEATGSSTSAASSTTTSGVSTGAETTTGGGGCGDGLAEEGELCFDFVEAELFPGVLQATADFNEDGHLDVLGISDGFCPAQPAPAPGIWDLTAAPAPPPLGPLAPRCPTLLRTAEGDGLGGFTPHLHELLDAPSGRTLAVADVDGDGHVDVITSEGGPTLVVLPGVGDGTFEAGVTHPSPGVLSDLAAGDVDGDGDVDVIAVGVAGITSFLGDGGGGFTPAPVAGLDDGPERREIILFDLDDDGALDLVINRADAVNSEIERWFGVGDGGFVEAKATPVEPGMNRLVAAARTPSDPAYLFVTAFTYDAKQWSLLGLEIDEDGGLGPIEVVVEDASAAEVVLGRFDGGLRWDAMLLSPPELRAILEVNLDPPPPAVAAEGSFALPYERVPVGDLNEDGVDDVVFGNGVLLSNP
ncbi:MAG: VCBS repeat-containing protein [Myxococcales bacterium]|nr:VCBS repeat-containing protein [Myxococcales bacterium]